MDKLVIVEDSAFFASVIHKRLERHGLFDLVTAGTLAEAQQIAEEGDIFLALLDLRLPDAPDGEVVDYFSEKAIPSIIFTSSFDPEIRQSLARQGIIDYVVKESPAGLDYLESLVLRLHANTRKTAIVVDDSSTMRKHVRRLLERLRLNVIEAENGEDTVLKIESHGDVSLVVTDYEMPKMDGFELIKLLRRTYSTDRMAIVGITGSDNHDTAAAFLKMGANDFLSKDFMAEEFQVRICHYLDHLDRIQELREAATTDFLTGLANRRHFFRVAEKIFANADRTGAHLALAMVDIDRFKLVNDTHGHDVGDKVLVGVADALKSSVRVADVVARLGGEEFCILLTNPDPESLPGIFDKVMAAINDCAVPVRGAEDLRVTASIGAVGAPVGSIERMLKIADDLLYEAKERGRNRTIIDYGADEDRLPENKQQTVIGAAIG